jgi:hypothetical protein
MPNLTHPSLFDDPVNNTVPLRTPSFLLTPEEYLARSTNALDGDVTTEQRAALPIGTLTHFISKADRLFPKAGGQKP